MMIKTQLMKPGCQKGAATLMTGQGLLSVPNRQVSISVREFLFLSYADEESYHTRGCSSATRSLLPLRKPVPK